MASRHPVSDGYEVRWRTLAGKQRSRKAPDAATADTLIRQVEQARALGRDWEPERPPARAALTQVAEDYLRSEALRLSRPTLRARVYQLQVWEQFALSAGLTHVDQLRRQSLEAYLRWLDSTPGRNGTVRDRSTSLRYVELVERMWAYAAEYAEEQDYGDVSRPRRITPDIERPPTQWRAAPTWAESAACVAAADGWLRVMVGVQFYTGLRPGQVLRLRRDDLDVDRVALRVRPELGKTSRERAGRVVAVTPHLVDFLDGVEASDGWMVPCSRAQRTPRDRDAERAWERARLPNGQAVRRVAWEGRPHNAFRAGFQSGIISVDRAHWIAVEHLVGHKISDTGPNYLDPDAFGMRAAVAVVPRLEDLW